MSQNPLIFILGLALLFIAIEWIMVVCGLKHSLGIEPNERSLHSKYTPTGGGIVWVLGAIIGICLYGNFECSNIWIFLGGIIILATISYIDDLHPLPPVPRLISQIVIMALTFKQLCYPQVFDIYLLVLFCGVGTINAINFLDGICGMLALYGIVVTGSLIYVLSLYAIPGLLWLIPFLEIVLVAQIVFACFNLYDKIFAGDIGSITLGYIQVFVAISLILATGDGSFIIFFAVCIFDTGLTTMQRLFAGISILLPHRMNLYQLLTTNKKIPQPVVSLIYALLQLLINALFFLIPRVHHWTYFLVVCSLLTIAYFMVRFSFRNQ